MHAVAEETELWRPVTEEEKNLVRQQMNRLLESTHFRNSRRYPALFRFLVEETLEGRGEFLKERLLGVHVFERPADYDTASDPIVRVTIAEIRKRIAQYYHEAAHQTELRIEMLSGHYAPEFHPYHELQEQHAAQPRAATHVGEAEQHKSERAATATIRPANARWRSVLGRSLVASAAVVVAAIGGIFVWNATHPTALTEFWQPILATHRTIMFCLPTPSVMIAGATPFTADGGLKMAPAPGALVPGNHDSSYLDHEDLGENVVFSDVLATLNISDYFAAQNHDSRAKLSTVITLDDLRQGPAVLIGGLDNPWTLLAVAHLRYRFFGNDRREFWIMDAKNPQQQDWVLKLDTPYAAVQHDYAIIARIHNENTGQMEVIVAGIGMSATAAAGAMLADTKQLDELRRRVGPGFRDHDFEAVVSSDVVNGLAGTPKIVAVTSW
jgi:hypothetical protein